MSRDQDMFNCGEYYEATYVVGLYNDKADKTVREFLEEKCDSNEINNSTHEDVYELLEANGFVRK
ncbi:MAG: hypothetical protein M0Q24_01380 [Sulfurimonas sp.]|uniref:hypothetical protein n=1 Tax=Sulfurimonas sp. TaxID=2022749 RepID=UPI0025FC235F|nr:hypothetical protein [Sulfurimonas sp.]MCK9490714.1 hypothetical protein [Sulfurimonas sp.]